MADRREALPQAAAPLRRALPSLEHGASALRDKAGTLELRFEPCGAALAREDARTLERLAAWLDAGCREPKP